MTDPRDIPWTPEEDEAFDELVAAAPTQGAAEVTKRPRRIMEGALSALKTPAPPAPACLIPLRKAAR